MDIKSYTEGEDKPQRSKMRCHIADQKVALEFLEQSGVEKQSLKNMSMIMHPEDQTVYMLMKQGGRKMALKTQVPESTSDEEEDNNVEIKKTGKTKKINGYTCHEYIVTDTENNREMQAWVATNKKFNNKRLFFYQNANPQQQKSSKGKRQRYDVEGWTMEATGTNTETGRKLYKYNISKVKEGKVNEDVFDLSGYQVMDMSDMPDNR
jgi:hypothetical protein